MRLFFYKRGNFRPFDTANKGGSLFYYPAFFKRYLRKTFAEQMFMVVIDGGDDGECRFENVGGIEPSSQSDFYHGNIDIFPGKI